jgi:ATP-dependent DNA helicase RecQ
MYREDSVAKPAVAQRKSRATLPDQPLTDEQMVLLGILKDVRLHLAKERGVPAYIVFPDRSLIHMAQRTPRTIEDFASITGVGAAKLKDFAEPFLAAIAGAVQGGS